MKLKKKHNIQYIIILLTLAMLLFSAAVFAESSEADEMDNCTAVYVGSAVSVDGTTMIARCADTHPTTVSCYFKLTEASDEPGRTVTGNNGFVYTLPDTTYQYWSFPRPAALEKGDSWDSVASNENGVAVTATVTGYVCEAALAADPYVEDGITEDNIAGIIAACADSSRSAVELIAEIIDTQGSGESNIFMVADTNECWYMEIYTGHQYAAVKLPEDCVAGFGNEFMLDTLEGFGDTIVSDELETLPAQAGYAEYNSDGRLNLFATYAGKNRLADYANLRTWRIHNLLAESTAGEYDTLSKYDFLYKPDKKVDTSDVIDIFRDRMEGTEYENRLESGKIRVIATETASHAHILKIHKDLPQAIAVEGWICLSNANYAPFVPISNAATEAISEYSYEVPAYEMDENSAHCIFKRLNALAAQDRACYGLGIESMWQEYETVWMSEFSDLLEQAAELYNDGKNDDATALMTAHAMAVQSQALTQAEQTTTDLEWYMMENTDTLRYEFSYDTLEFADEPVEYAAFIPMINAADYAKSYGWSAEATDDELTLSNGDESLRIIPTDGKRTSTGTLVKNDEEIQVAAVSRDDGIYLSLDTAIEYLKTDTVAAADMSEYITADSIGGYLPIIIIGIIAALAACAAVLRKKAGK